MENSVPGQTRFRMNYQHIDSVVEGELYRAGINTKIRAAEKFEKMVLSVHLSV